jgi:hypothetical protein
MMTASDTLMVDDSTRTVDSGTRTVDGGTLTVGNDTLMSDDQHRLVNTITNTTWLRRHQAKQHPQDTDQ